MTVALAAEFNPDDDPFLPPRRARDEKRLKIEAQTSDPRRRVPYGKPVSVKDRKRRFQKP